MKSTYYDLPVARAGLEALDAVARGQEEEWLLLSYAFSHELDHVFQFLYAVAPDLALHLGTLTSALPRMHLTERKELSAEVQKYIASWRTSYLPQPYLSDQRVHTALLAQ